jgi:hypothetical protein
MLAWMSLGAGAIGYATMGKISGSVSQLIRIGSLPRSMPCESRIFCSANEFWI